MLEHQDSIFKSDIQVENQRSYDGEGLNSKYNNYI